jgi:hypothetical protein
MSIESPRVKLLQQDVTSYASEPQYHASGPQYHVSVS